MSISADKKLAYGSAMMSAVLMGSMGVFIRNIAADATFIAFARLSLGFLFLIGFLALSGKLGAAKIQISSSLVASGLSIGLCVWSYIQAIEHTTLANAVFLLYLGPLLAIGLARLVLGERITLRGIVLINLAFVGFLLILRFDFSLSGADASGTAYGLLSALTYAVTIVTNRNIPPDVSPLGRTFYQLLFAALTLLPFQNLSAIPVQAGDLPWLIALGFVQGFVCLTLMIFAIRHLTTYEYGILSYLEPVTAALIGVMVYAEPMTPLQALGGCLIVSSGIAQISLMRTNRPQTG